MEMETDTDTPTDTRCSDAKSNTCTRLGLCEVCATEIALYTCPRCEVKTCSLKCSKIHKLELECDGQRDRTKYVPLNKFTNLDLSSDYRLLEEITRSLESSKKNFGRNSAKFLPNSLFKLRNAARARRINLKFLPFKFARRKNNTTFLQKNDLIFWHIEWVFIAADNLKIIDAKVCETEKLSSILSKHLMSTNESSAEKLQYYRAVGTPGIKLYLKAEQKDGNKFYELDVTAPLKENLEKKLIIEHPIIHVVLKDHEVGYRVIDSDDEDMETDGQDKTGSEVVHTILTKAKSHKSSNEPSKNLLFTSDCSDEEIVSE